MKDILLKGLFKENPVFVMMLGMCPTLGVTTSALNGLGMGLATCMVLMMSNVAIASVKNFIPAMVRIPCFIVIIASFVTIVEMLMMAYVPSIYQALGIFIPLIVVNCLILGRAEAFASKNNIKDSLLDAIGMGLGFAIALTILGAVREVLGDGAIFGYKFVSEDASTILFFIMPPGAFLALSGLVLLANKLRGAK